MIPHRSRERMAHPIDPGLQGGYDRSFTPAPEAPLMRRAPIWLLVIVLALASALCRPAVAKDVDLQPLAAQATRIADALDHLGAPLSPDDRKALEAAAKETDPAKGVAGIERVLDPRCL